MITTTYQMCGSMEKKRRQRRKQIHSRNNEAPFLWMLSAKSHEGFATVVVALRNGHLQNFNHKTKMTQELRRSAPRHEWMCWTEVLPNEPMQSDCALGAVGARRWSLRLSPDQARDAIQTAKLLLECALNEEPSSRKKVHCKRCANSQH